MEKVCVNHPESPSVGSCKACEKPVCLMCITEVQGVSFCSDACGAAYQEVKDWLERPAAEEEWNPLAEAKAKAAPAPKAVPPPPPAPVAAPEPEPVVSDAGGSPVRQAPDQGLDDPASPVLAVRRAPPSGTNRTMLYVAIAATVLVIIGAIVVLTSGENKEPVVAKTDPAKADPPKPLPPPPKPEPAKVDPPKPKPEPVVVVPQPPPPKPEPAKVDLPKPKPEPVVVVPPPPPPKPEPAKVDPPKPPPPPPPKPEPAKVDPPKPPPPPPKPDPVVVVPPPPPKPEPAKVEPPKPPPPPPPPPPKPEPVKVDPPKPEPPPAPHLAFIRDPWGKEKAGSWYRVKTTVGGKDSYKDVGLRETGPGYRVLVSQSSAEGKTEPEQFSWTEPEEVSTFGSVEGKVNGMKYAADVVRTKASKPSQFVLKGAPYEGAYFSSDAVLASLDTQTLKIRTREVRCTVIRTEPKDGKKGSTLWFSTQVPLAIVKSESDEGTSQIIDAGDEWEKRPPFPAPPAPLVPPPPPPPKPEPVVVAPPPPPPPPKPEPVVVAPPPPPPPPPPKPEPAKVEPPPLDPAKQETALRVKKSLADAAALIKEASPIFSEVSNAMDALPTDRASLRDLYRKAERAQLKLSDARILYSSIRGDAPDPTLIERRVKQLDELLDGVGDALKTLRGRIE